MAEAPEHGTASRKAALQDDEPAALNASQGHDSEDSEDESEWEYEYSTTETETYYLTLELSYPEYKGQAPPTPHHSRGGYYKKWGQAQDNAPESSRFASRSRSQKPTATPQPPETGDQGTVEGETAQDEGEGSMAIDPSLRIDDEAVAPKDSTDTQVAGNGGNDEQAEHQEETQTSDNGEQEREREKAGPQEDIQILELHSRNPIISYRGRVFEGSWAEMIGTDLILAHHESDSEDPLPALRNLPGDIDVLAASASRILTKRKELRSKVPEVDSLAEVRKEYNINIPVGKNKHSERAKQASFLEKLIALKLKRGDEDQVTVYATDGRGKDFHDDKDPDSKPRRKRAKFDQGLESGLPARPTGRPPGRPSNRAWQGAGGSSRGAEMETADTMSVPTPRTWADLGRRDEGDHDEEDEEDDDDDDYESVDVSDLEGPGGSDTRIDDDDRDTDMDDADEHAEDEDEDEDFGHDE